MLRPEYGIRHSNPYKFEQTPASLDQDLPPVLLQLCASLLLKTLPEQFLALQHFCPLPLTLICPLLLPLYVAGDLLIEAL